MTEEQPIKRGPGRPRKNPIIEREERREPTSTSFKMRAKPNWEDLDVSSDDTPDRLRIRAGIIPEGLSAQWVTDSVYGQSMAQHRAEFERKGWTPVHQEDFDGSLDGLFMPKGNAGEIKVEGLVLMVRPKEMTARANLEDKRKAVEQVMIKEQAMRGGDIPISLDSRHPSALSANKITKSLEQFDIPGPDISRARR